MRRRFVLCGGAAAVVASYVLLRSASTAPLPPHPPVELFRYGARAAWDDFDGVANLAVLDDARLQTRGRAVPIDDVHGGGLLHRGAWLAVARRGSRHEYEYLLLRRGPQLKTCPGAWGLVGEHPEFGEHWRETAARALREELGVSAYDVSNLAPNRSFLVKVAYDESDRRDLQATTLLRARIRRDQVLAPDEEVAEMRWVSPSELRKLEFCNAAITALAHVVADLLESAPPPGDVSL